MSDNDFIQKCKKQYRIIYSIGLGSYLVVMLLGLSVCFSAEKTLLQKLLAFLVFVVAATIAFWIISFGYPGNPGVLIERLRCHTVKDWLHFGDTYFIFIHRGPDFLSKRLEIENLEIEKVYITKGDIYTMHCKRQNEKESEEILLYAEDYEFFNLFEDSSLPDRSVVIDLSGKHCKVTWN